jgi:hypothetical protein
VQHLGQRSRTAQTGLGHRVACTTPATVHHGYEQAEVVEMNPGQGNCFRLPSTAAPAPSFMGRAIWAGHRPYSAHADAAPPRMPSAATGSAASSHWWATSVRKSGWQVERLPGKHNAAGVVHANGQRPRQHRRTGGGPARGAEEGQAAKAAGRQCVALALVGPPAVRDAGARFTI